MPLVLSCRLHLSELVHLSKKDYRGGYEREEAVCGGTRGDEQGFGTCVWDDGRSVSDSVAQLPSVVPKGHDSRHVCLCNYSQHGGLGAAQQIREIYRSSRVIRRWLQNVSAASF